MNYIVHFADNQLSYFLASSGYLQNALAKKFHWCKFKKFI